MVLRFAAGCLRRLLVLALLVAFLALAWRHRDRLREVWWGLRGDAAAAVNVVSPAVADTAEQKLVRLAESDGPSRIGLGEYEVQSLVEYRMTELVPAYVIEPQIRFRRGRVRLSGRVATDHLASAGGLGEVLVFLPDTTDLDATGRLVPHEGARVALEITEIEAARIPIPERVIPRLLDLLGRPAGEPPAPNAVVLPLPPGAKAAYVSGDSLILLARDRNGASAS